MKEITYKIPDESSALVTEIVEKLGGMVEKETQINITAKKEKKVSPTFLFGKWKNSDIDASTLRKELWTRKF
jgi:hypothetical protein